MGLWARMFFRQKGEKPYVIKDTKDFTTNHFTFVCLGFVYDGSLFSKLRFCFTFFFFYSAPIHHSLSSVLYPSITSDEEKLTAMAINMLYVLLGCAWPYMIVKSSHVIELGKTVRKGFYKYSDPLTDEERTILSKYNDRIVKSTRFFLVAYFFAGGGTFFRKLTPNSLRDYTFAYPAWFPWAISSNFRYSMGLLYQLIVCFNTSFGLDCILLIFLYYVINLESQMALMRKHFQDTFPPGLPKELTHSTQYKQRTLKRLKECVQHHIVIKEFHSKIIAYFGFCLLVFRSMCTIMLCFLCYLATTSGMGFNKYLLLAGLGQGCAYLLLIFCVKGEQVTKTSEMWRETLYEVEWWNQPVEVQKTVFQMYFGASQPFTIYGIWKPVMYSHEGLSAIGEQTFSFFNMLRAMN